MSITISVDDMIKTVSVSITGNFNFGQRNEFKQVLNVANECGQYRYILDLSQVEGIDSSAIGMILLLKDLVGGEQANLEITRISESIKDEMELTRISTLVKVA